ncbi:MAG: UDP-N-acetylglucosamine 1-carboxyvinyltransferase, partial [Candidatus Poribacteria bacterium]|nr:UDP-N-acetylglucosamine 1-carboxyvinyltransferase [Candidatus Poribacteria bacterium]
MKASSTLASLPIAFAAGILGTTDSRITNVPSLSDVATARGLLDHLGVHSGLNDNTLTIQASDRVDTEAPYDLVRKMRSSIYVLGPLLARFGEARVSFPGGCAIGSRPVDLHLKGMEALGANITVEHGYIIAKADRLKGAEFSLMGPRGSSHGATANVMMAAVLAEGTTVIHDAAMEPEVVDLADCLNGMGAKITGMGTRTIKIEGVESLKGAQHNVIPDRMEAGSFLIAAAITHGDVRVRGIERKHLSSVLGKLTEADVWLDWERKECRVTVP